MAVTKGLLSGTSANDGQAYDVTTSVTTVHTGPTATTSYDEIWIYATNASATDAVLHIGWGANPDTLDDNRIKVTIPTKTGYKLVIPGLILKGNASALTVECKASLANSINLTGYVNHITA
tara:strand:- start:1130 stop:1492 length:363 start_codon:yes stop_codon:yes gene_type:complete